MSEVSSSCIRRVGILFAGGPAPGANAVISSAALAFLKADIEVVGFLHGYSKLQDFDEEKSPLLEGDAYEMLTFSSIIGARNRRGIMIGTARQSRKADSVSRRSRRSRQIRTAQKDVSRFA